MIWQRDWIEWWSNLGRPFQRLPRLGAVGVLALLLAAMVWTGFAVQDFAAADAERRAQNSAETAGADVSSDFELYVRINERLAEGESYYSAATAEHRANDFPTSPAVTVRLPTLAWLNDLTGSTVVHLLMGGMLILSLLCFVAGMGGQLASAERIGLSLAILIGGAGVILDKAPLFHDMAAGLLLSIALAIYRPDRWVLSLVLTGLALATREMAMAFVILWFAFALLQRRWAELVGLTFLTALFALGLYFHAQEVAAYRLPSDFASQGWDGMQGPLLPLASLARYTLLFLLPAWLAAPIAILPLVGWLGLGGRTGLFVAGWFIGMALAMAVFARAENAYWIAIILPAYAAGLAFVPRAIADLVRSTVRA